MSPVIEKPNNLIDRLLTSQILVGLDVGSKTIGIAVSDISFTIATPINTVLRKGTIKDLAKMIIKIVGRGKIAKGIKLNDDAEFSCANVEKIKNIGFKGFTKLSDGLKKVVSYE